MDDNYLTVVDEDGSEILCEILFTFDSDDSDKSYVFYIPVETSDEEDVEVLCSSYTALEDGTIGDLQPIENDEEWDMVEEVFNTYVESEEDEDDDDDDEEEDDDDDSCCCGHDHHHDDDHECSCEDDDEECCCDHHEGK